VPGRRWAGRRGGARAAGRVSRQQAVRPAAESTALAVAIGVRVIKLTLF
jgi:hypothetical protein